jgi:hypothetical protein
VLRVLYGFCRAGAHEMAVVLVGGDKTTLGSRWYPPHVAEAQLRLDQYSREYPEVTPIVKRGDR